MLDDFGIVGHPGMFIIENRRQQWPGRTGSRTRYTDPASMLSHLPSSMKQFFQQGDGGN